MEKEAMKKFDRTRISLVAVAVLLGVALIVAFGGRGDGGDAIADGRSYQDRFGVLEDFTPAVEASLSPMESERLSFRQLMMAQEMGPEDSVHLDEVRRPKVDSYGRLKLADSGWVAMATIDDHFCAWYVKGAGICGTEQQIEDSGIAASSQVDANRWQVLAIVPEGVERVEVDSTGDGSFAFRTPVRSGVYSAEFPSRPIKVRGLDQSGEVVFRDLIPLDEFARGSVD